ncbi:uncharacterized protein LOC124276018 [Haliotis rubra]|uniref:uncharacterized protein LOC124276018 n=1 Tax=Haliotis rubra TaxID=36100 RepID=UPI001EE521D1|nr:uncharacterized protein LOC124276018 [Haliotis rubra]
MCNEKNNNIQYTTSLQDNLKCRPPPSFPRPGEQQRGCRMQESSSTQDKEKKKSSSFTGTIQLGGGSNQETLVIASTCLKSLLKAANLFSMPHEWRADSDRQ